MMHPVPRLRPLEGAHHPNVLAPMVADGTFDRLIAKIAAPATA
jgi:hypothetical protein